MSGGAGELKRHRQVIEEPQMVMMFAPVATDSDCDVVKDTVFMLSSVFCVNKVIMVVFTFML